MQTVKMAVRNAKTLELHAEGVCAHFVTRVRQTDRILPSLKLASVASTEVSLEYSEVREWRRQIDGAILHRSRSVMGCCT